MHPIERLRSVARAGAVDATELACEAAYALAGLADDRRALVQSCRRLLEFHPDCGPLWWVSAHALDAADLRAALFAAADRLACDTSIDELFALPASNDVVVAQASRQIIRGLHERPDIAVRLIGAPNQLRSGLRFFSGAYLGAQGFLTEEIGEALGGASMAVVEVCGASATGYLFDEPGRLIAHAATRAGIPLHVLAGVGRILPVELFATMVGALANRSERAVFPAGGPTDEELAGLVPAATATSRRGGNLPAVPIVAISCAASVITERGQHPTKVAFHPNPVVSHQRCPVPAELLVPFGVAG